MKRGNKESSSPSGGKPGRGKAIDRNTLIALARAWELKARTADDPIAAQEAAIRSAAFADEALARGADGWLGDARFRRDFGDPFGANEVYLRVARSANDANVRLDASLEAAAMCLDSGDSEAATHWYRNAVRIEAERPDVGRNDPTWVQQAAIRLQDAGDEAGAAELIQTAMDLDLERSVASGAERPHQLERSVLHAQAMLNLAISDADAVEGERWARSILDLAESAEVWRHPEHLVPALNQAMLALRSSPDVLEDALCPRDDEPPERAIWRTVMEGATDWHGLPDALGRAALEHEIGSITLAGEQRGDLEPPPFVASERTVIDVERAGSVDAAWVESLLALTTWVDERTAATVRDAVDDAARIVGQMPPQVHRDLVNHLEAHGDDHTSDQLLRHTVEAARSGGQGTLDEVHQRVREHAALAGADTTAAVVDALAAAPASTDFVSGAMPMTAEAWAAAVASARECQADDPQRLEADRVRAKSEAVAGWSRLVVDGGEPAVRRMLLSWDANPELPADGSTIVSRFRELEGGDLRGKRFEYFLRASMVIAGRLADAGDQQQADAAEQAPERVASREVGDAVAAVRDPVFDVDAPEGGIAPGAVKAPFTLSLEYASTYARLAHPATLSVAARLADGMKPYLFEQVEKGLPPGGDNALSMLKTFAAPDRLATGDWTEHAGYTDDLAALVGSRLASGEAGVDIEQRTSEVLAGAPTLADRLREDLSGLMNEAEVLAQLLGNDADLDAGPPCAPRALTDVIEGGPASGRRPHVVPDAVDDLERGFDVLPGDGRADSLEDLAADVPDDVGDLDEGFDF